MSRYRAFAIALLLAAGSLPLRALEEKVPGPIEAEVLRVIDGDTLEVRARIWLGIEVTTLLRLDGIDTPELRGKCPAERELASRARAFLAARIGAGPVLLSEVREDKFGGRVIAQAAAGGEDLAAALIAAGLARAYLGGAREGWCGG